MYRVHGNDGLTYEAPSLAALQDWVQEGRIIPSTVVEDLLSGTEGPASGIEGLRFHTEAADGSFAPEYPRATSQSPGCMMHLPLALAIVVTSCFTPLAFPLGIVAIVYAAKIPQLIQMGDTEKAAQYARIATRIAMLSFIVGVLWVSLLMNYGKSWGLPMP